MVFGVIFILLFALGIGAACIVANYRYKQMIDKEWKACSNSFPTKDSVDDKKLAETP